MTGDTMIDRGMIKLAAGWLDRSKKPIVMPTKRKSATKPAKLEPTQVQLPPLNPAQQMMVANAEKNGPLNGPDAQQKFFGQMAENIRTGVGFPQ